MKTEKNVTWARLLRRTVALMLVFALLLCGCAGTQDDDGTKNENNLALGNGKLEPQDAVDGVSSIYGLLLKLLGGELELDGTMEMAMENEIVVTLGDELKTQLGHALAEMGMSSDLSWFQNIGFTMSNVSQGDHMQMNVDAKVNGKHVIAAQLVMDMVGGMLYATLPDLNEQSLGIPMNMAPQNGTVLPDSGSGDIVQETPAAGTSVLGLLLLGGGSFTDLLAEHAELIQALPTEKQMNALLGSYMEVILACLDEATETTENLSHGGVTQSVTSSTYILTMHNLLDMGIAALNKAKTDTELEKALDAFSALINAVGPKKESEAAPQQSDEATQVDLHEMLMANMDEMLEDMQDTKENNADGEFLRFTSYTAGGKTVGFQLTLTAMDAVMPMPDQPDQNVTVVPKPVAASEPTSRITVYSLENGGKTAFYLNVADSFELSGTGTVQSGKSSGNYSLKLGGVEYLQVELKDFTADALNSENLEGTVRLRLGEGLKAQLQTPNWLFNENTMVELQLQVSGKNVAMIVKMYSGDTYLYSIATTMKPISGGTVQVPENFVNVTGQEPMAQWLNNMKPDTVLENLENAGVPKEVIQSIIQLIENGSKEEGPQRPNEMNPEYGY